MHRTSFLVALVTVATACASKPEKAPPPQRDTGAMAVAAKSDDPPAPSPAPVAETAPLSSASAAEWTRFVDPEERFSVLCPSPLIERKGETFKSVWGYSIVTRGYWLDAKSVGLFLNYADYGLPIPPGKETAAMLEIATRPHPKYKVRVVESRLGTFRGYPALETKVELNDGKSIVKGRQRLVLVYGGRRMYKLTAYVERDPDSPEIARFLDSLEILR
jgi:hypothetical protein